MLGTETGLFLLDFIIYKLVLQQVLLKHSEKYRRKCKNQSKLLGVYQEFLLKLYLTQN